MSKRKLNLLQYYEDKVRRQEIQKNAQQEQVLRVLEQVYLQRKSPWKFKKSKTSVYIYGSVGSGKTYVMDLFFTALPMKQKWRVHFYHFMEVIAQKLREYQGVADPMVQLVHEFCSCYQVICIDELMIQDVVQAMWVRDLLLAVLQRGVMLVFTANLPPEQLYVHGLQRMRFLDFIKGLEKYAWILPLAQIGDYRLQRLPFTKQTYVQASLPLFKQMFLDYATVLQTSVEWHKKITVLGREIQSVAVGTPLIWFSFDQLIAIPRCQRDYLTLVQEYQVFFISDLKKIMPEATSSLILWMCFIDVLYDARVKLLICAEVALDQLYAEGPMLPEFKRTLSRMQEMQSQWYWEL